MKDFETHPTPDLSVNKDRDQQDSSLNTQHVNSHKVGIAVLALVFGVVGGLYGSLDLSHRPFFQKLFGNRSSLSSVYEQNLVLNEESATTEVVKKAGPAVVSIIISKDVNQLRQFQFDPFGFLNQQNSNNSNTPNVQKIGAGSGFIVSEDGMIVTNKHVVSDATAQYTVMTSDGKSYEAKVLALDPSNDIAIVKIDIKNAPYLQLADSSKLQLGQHVIAIGNSLGQYQNTITSGIISGIGRSITAGGGGELEQLEGVIQTDAAINSGNSGGPLLDLTGKIIGINTAIDQQGQSIGFALPANDVKIALESFNKDGKITRPYLGVRYLMITDVIFKSEKLGRDYGALILGGNAPTDFAVIPSSPADKAGLLEGDIILEVAGKKLTPDYSLPRALKEFRPNDKVEMKIFSNDNEKNITVTLGEIK